MKRKIFAIVILIGTYSSGIAQSANHVYEPSEYTGQGYMVLNSGDTLKGEIYMWTKNSERVWIKLSPKDKGRTEYKPSQIRCFKFNDTGRLYESLQQKSSSGKLEDSAFYERINPANFKFGLYRQYQSTGKMVGGKLEGWYTEFISISGHLGLTSIGSKEIRPLNEKLPLYLTDCPELKLKVQESQEGYKMPVMQDDSKKMAILRKIAEEYETCAK